MKRIFVNISVFIIATILHACLQTLLGSFIASRPITDLPQTTIITLAILIFAFISILMGFVMQSNGIAHHLREKSLINFLTVLFISVVLVLIFRVPYSSVFLFWGLVLQIILWIPALLIFERINRPIIGMPKSSLSEFANFIHPSHMRMILPNTTKFAELDMIVLKESELNSYEWSDCLINCMTRSIKVEEFTNFKERLNGRVDLDQLSWSKSQKLIGENAYLPLKRTADILVSACLLILLLPLMFVVVLFIMAEGSTRPIFQQRRVGFRGRQFMIYKFRTMRTGGSCEKIKFTEQDDVRITRVGKFLRNKRIDELPQLWNVLIGDMSLIGPRPEQVELIGSIQEEIPAFSLRHSIRPGITGWAQVHQGYAGDISATRKKLSYDLWYLNNVSLLVDVYITIRTLRVMLTGFGSR